MSESQWQQLNESCRQSFRKLRRAAMALCQAFRESERRERLGTFRGTKPGNAGEPRGTE